MAAFKGKKGKWTVSFRYKDWRGITKIKKKEGFATKHEALEFERAFIMQAEKDMDMTFEQFFELYAKDNQHNLRPHTWIKKMFIMDKHIMPYFGEKIISEITNLDIIEWQNELQNIRDSEGKAYSQTYLRAIQNEFYAVMNHAEMYYKLENNPCRKVRKMGKNRSKEMQFWTTDEYFKFREAISEDPVYYYAFEVLFWCGIREGELLALTMEDFDLEKKILRINKSYQRINGRDVITDPKTERSNRLVVLPDFLCEEMEDYFESLGKSNKKARIFPGTKGKMHHLMDRYSEIAGVKRIRIHDLRHSCAALLINNDVSTFVIADRLGHQNAHVTEVYAHLYPSAQTDMAKKLDTVVEANSGIRHGGKYDETV